MTGGSAAALALSQPGHHYHGAFQIVLAVIVAALIAVVAVVVVRARRPARTPPGRRRHTTAPRPATPLSRARTVAGAVCWLLALGELAGEAIAQAAWKTPYSLAQDYISALGVTRCGTYRVMSETTYICSPQHDVMNVSFVLSGVLIVAGVLLLRGIWPRGPLATAGLALIALAGAGRIGAGLAPANVDMTLHDLAALGILGGDIGAVLLGCAIWRPRRWEAAGFLAAGVAGTSGFLLMAAAPARHLPAGAFERVASWPLLVWLAALGLALIASRKASQQPPDRSACVFPPRPGLAGSAARGGGSAAAAPASRVHAPAPRRRRTPR